MVKTKKYKSNTKNKTKKYKKISPLKRNSNNLYSIGKYIQRISLKTFKELSNINSCQ